MNQRIRVFSLILLAFVLLMSAACLRIGGALSSVSGPSAGEPPVEPTVTAADTPGFEPSVPEPPVSGPSDTDSPVQGTSGDDGGPTDPGMPSTNGYSDGAESDPGPEEKVFVTVSMDDADIHRGNLMLINSENRYDIPENFGYVAIEYEKTQSYRVADSLIAVHPSIIVPLNNMMDAFYAETGIGNVTIISAFRDYAKQKKVFDDYAVSMGRAEALKRAALPGYSEHHTGLAFDLGIYRNGAMATFKGDGSYAWFKDNSYKFGFILRYPAEKSSITKIVHEPWHFRYVGKLHASIIFENGWCFEEYMDFIMELTQEESYTIDFDDGMYEIFYTQDNEILIPEDLDYTISGNNIDGFIVTVKWSLSNEDVPGGGRLGELEEGP